MVSKYVAWVLGGALVLVLGAFVFFWKSQDKVAVAPTASNQAAPSAPAPVQPDTSSVMKTAPTSDASLDDIGKSIGADVNVDQAAITNDATAELGSLSEGNATINDLGQSYDETKY
jgi:hypothetical protein